MKVLHSAYLLLLATPAVVQAREQGLGSSLESDPFAAAEKRRLKNNQGGGGGGNVNANPGGLTEPGGFCLPWDGPKVQDAIEYATSVGSLLTCGTADEWNACGNNAGAVGCCRWHWGSIVCDTSNDYPKNTVSQPILE
jgi:hypothetical protein